ncbi:MAG: hypothetical protein IJY79_00885 [Clostridia bacterium]|nr:hypothetical protein [Clostridia bacterium]
MKDSLKQKIKYWVKTVVQFILNPRLLLCFGLAWLITNGWAYITAAIAVWLDIGWLGAVAGGYLAALWIPFTPEKIVTVIIAIFLLKLLFPNDKKTLEKLHNMKEKAKAEIKKLKIKHKEKKEHQDK